MTGVVMITIWTCLVFAAAQTPAPSKPVAPPAIPPGVIVKSDLFPEDKQWDAMACTARLSGSDGELGTAVVVGIRDGSVYLLTANHVVSGNAERKLEFFSKDKYFKPLVLSITELPVFRAPQADIAIVKVSLGNAKPLSLVMKIPPPNPEARPRKFPTKALSIGCSKGAEPTCRIEEITAKILVRKANDGGTFFWQTEAPSIEGRSGGPLIVNKAGSLSLIGICTATQGQKGYYTHLDEIHVALKEGGYSWIWESNKAP